MAIRALLNRWSDAGGEFGTSEYAMRRVRMVPLGGRGRGYKLQELVMVDYVNPFDEGGTEYLWDTLELYAT